MSIDPVSLAFDRAIEQVERARRAGLRTLTGQSAGEQLRRLRGDLLAERDASAARGAVDRDAIGRLVRYAAEWLPTDEIRLLAALGAIARMGPAPAPPNEG